ncbi:hypothetical protein ACOME3_008521 [Neoechinorhynchus agilis]
MFSFFRKINKTKAGEEFNQTKNVDIFMTNGSQRKRRKKRHWKLASSSSSKQKDEDVSEARSTFSNIKTQMDENSYDNSSEFTSEVHNYDVQAGRTVSDVTTTTDLSQHIHHHRTRHDDHCPPLVFYLGNECNLVRERSVEPPANLQHFHRPVNFSYRSYPSYKLPYKTDSEMKKLLSSQASIRSAVRRDLATSPDSLILEHHPRTGDESKTSSSTSIHENTIEPRKLARFSGGYEPNPCNPTRMETLAWPSPLLPAAVPELRKHCYKWLNESSLSAKEGDATITFGQPAKGAKLGTKKEISLDLNHFGVVETVLKHLKNDTEIVMPWRYARCPSATRNLHSETRYHDPSFASPSRLARDCKAYQKFRRRKYNSASEYGVKEEHEMKQKRNSCDPSVYDQTLDSSVLDEDVVILAQQNEGSVSSRETNIPTISVLDFPTYPYSQLRTDRLRSTPADMDRNHLEQYLSNEEFLKIFGLKKEQFYLLPQWRQMYLKRINKLF